MKAIIISQPRSGTQMLAAGLGQHPDVGIYSWPTKDENLWQQVNEIHENSFSVTVITTHHYWGEEWAQKYCGATLDEFWTRMSELHDRAILLRRNNPLKRYVSEEITKTLGIGVTAPRSKDPKVIVDPRDFVRQMISSYEYWDRIQQHFPDALVISYEALDELWGSTICRIQRYLGLTEMKLLPITYRQESRPLCDIIKNYGEVRQFLASRLTWTDWVEER